MVLPTRRLESARSYLVDDAAEVIGIGNPTSRTEDTYFARYDLDADGNVVGFLDPSGADFFVPTGWRDLTSAVSAAGVPASSAPTRAAFGPSGLREEYAFDIGEYIFMDAFHVDHDVMPGGKAYIHVHWSSNGTSTGLVRWELQIMRARGHQQAAFGAPTTVYVEQAGYGVAWEHMVAECSDADALTLTEPDELILVTLRRATPTSGSNLNTIFGLTVDFHYQTDRYATPNKSPNFYE